MNDYLYGELETAVRQMMAAPLRSISPAATRVQRCLDIIDSVTRAEGREETLRQAVSLARAARRRPLSRAEVSALAVGATAREAMNLHNAAVALGEADNVPARAAAALRLMRAIEVCLRNQPDKETTP